jgi:ABC-type sugar transport system substrate-binding protein
MMRRLKAASAAAAGTAAALAATALLSGCGTAGASTTGVSSDTSVEMIAGTQNSSFYLSMECGAAQEARRLGINLTVVAQQKFTAADQIPLVRGVIVGNPDALIISPASPTALDQDLTVAEENDTKIILADTSVADRNVGASRITSDNAAGGKIAADNLGRMLGGKGSVALITAPDGGPAATARITAFRQEIAARYPAIRLLTVQNDTSGDIYHAKQLTADDIKGHPDLAAVLGLTADTAQGAIAAIGKAHKQGVVKVATFDASPLQMTWLGAGAIQLAVAQEPVVEGADAVTQAVSAIADRKVTPSITTPMIAITRQNMSKAYVKPYIYDGTCVSSLRGYMTSGD